MQCRIAERGAPIPRIPRNTERVRRAPCCHARRRLPNRFQKRRQQEAGDVSRLRVSQAWTEVQTVNVQPRSRRLRVLHQESVVVHAAEQPAGSVEQVLAHHLAGRDLLPPASRSRTYSRYSGLDAMRSPFLRILRKPLLHPAPKLLRKPVLAIPGLTFSLDCPGGDHLVQNLVRACDLQADCCCNI